MMQGLDHEITFEGPEADTLFRTNRWGVYSIQKPVHRITCQCGWTEKNERRERVQVSYMQHRREARA